MIVVLIAHVLRIAGVWNHYFCHFCARFYIHEIPFNVSLLYLFLIMVCISSNLLNYVTVNCHHLRIYSVLCSHPLYTSQVRTSLLSKFLIEHGVWVHGYTSTILYCNSVGTLTSVVISSLVDMQGLYIVLCDNMMWYVMTHFYCVYICVVFCVYVKLFSIQFS
jgi:hypothetical protein